MLEQTQVDLKCMSLVLHCMHKFTLWNQGSKYVPDNINNHNSNSGAC